MDSGHPVEVVTKDDPVVLGYQNEYGQALITS
jgi:hypothetical protein